MYWEIFSSAFKLFFVLFSGEGIVWVVLLAVELNTESIDYVFSELVHT